MEVKQFSRLRLAAPDLFFDFARMRHYHRAPMFGVLPDRIAPDQLLAAGGRAQGSVPLNRLERLAGCLRDEQKDAAHADLVLTLDPQGRYWLQGRVDARLVLRCERCLGPMEWPIEGTIGIFLVPSESAAAALSEDADYAVVEGGIRLHELIEDELILALPLVAKHPPGTPCGDRAEQGPIAVSGERDSPFAILGKLKI